MEAAVCSGAAPGRLPKPPPDVLQALSPACAPFAPAKRRSFSGQEEDRPLAEIRGILVASASAASAGRAALQRQVEQGLEAQEHQARQLSQGLERQLQQMRLGLDAQDSRLESLCKQMTLALGILEGQAPKSPAGLPRRHHAHVTPPAPPSLPTPPESPPELAVRLWGSERRGSCAAAPCSGSGSGSAHLEIPDRAFLDSERQSTCYSDFSSSSSDADAKMSPEQAHISAAEFDVFTRKLSRWRPSGSSIDERSHAIEIHRKRIKVFEVVVPFGVREMLVSAYERWEGIEEPQRKGRLVTFLHRCQPFFLAIIVFNAFWIAWVVNFEAENLSRDLPGHVPLVEAILLAIYTVELALRFAVHRAYFFCNDEMGWNLTDLILAAYSFLELSVNLFDSHWSFLRAIRVFKVLRIVRVVKFLHPMRLMLACLLGSLTSLFWSLFLTLVILYVFSIIFVQGVVHYERTHSASDEPLTDFFGTVPRALLSLFIILSGGNDWYEYYDAICATGASYAGIFLFFVAFSQIALLNVVAAIFVEKALKLAEPTFEQKALKLADEELGIRAHLLHLLKLEFGLEPTDDLPVAIFFRELHGTKLIRYLHFIGVRAHEVVHLMEKTGALGGNKTTKVKEFVSGCMRARGVATSMELQHLLYEIRHMRFDHGGMLGRIHRSQQQYMRGRKGHRPQSRSNEPS